MRKFLALVLSLIFLFISSQLFAGPVKVSTTLASAIITNARSYLNDAGTAFGSAAQMLVWLNDGTTDLASKSLCTEATESIDLVNATREYTPTADYIFIAAVIYTDSAGAECALKRSNIRIIGDELQSTTPGYFYDFAGKVGVSPVLATRTTEKITVYMVTRPAAVAAGAAITTPAIYDRALTYYIVAQAFIRDNKLNSAKGMLALYQAEIDLFKGDLSGSTKETAEPVR